MIGDYDYVVVVVVVIGKMFDQVVLQFDIVFVIYGIYLV